MSKPSLSPILLSRNTFLGKTPEKYRKPEAAVGACIKCCNCHSAFRIQDSGFGCLPSAPLAVASRPPVPHQDDDGVEPRRRLEVGSSKCKATPATGFSTDTTSPSVCPKTLRQGSDIFLAGGGGMGEAPAFRPSKKKAGPQHHVAGVWSSPPAPDPPSVLLSPPVGMLTPVVRDTGESGGRRCVLGGGGDGGMSPSQLSESDPMLQGLLFPLCFDPSLTHRNTPHTCLQGVK